MTCVCHYCHKESDGPEMPEGWDLIFQCYICGDCLERAKREHPSNWLYTVKAGAYAEGKPDPRTPEWQRRNREFYDRRIPAPRAGEEGGER